MNIAEILKDCPKDTKLYSTIFGECYLHNVSIDSPFPIQVRFRKPEGDLYYVFTKEGKYTPTGECCLFPSKDNRDWSTFKVKYEFKKGDIIYRKLYNGTEWLSIHTKNESTSRGDIHSFADVCLSDMYVSIDTVPWELCFFKDVKEARLATEEEKQKLFKELDKKGYKWDAEKLELVKKPKEYTFEPFDKVLVRDSEDEKWLASLFSHYEYENRRYKFCCIDDNWHQCIPYEGNEHLLGTSDKPKE